MYKNGFWLSDTLIWQSVLLTLDVFLVALEIALTNLATMLNSNEIVFSRNKAFYKEVDQ